MENANTQSEVREAEETAPSDNTTVSTWKACKDMHMKAQFSSPLLFRKQEPKTNLITAELPFCKESYWKIVK